MPRTEVFLAHSRVSFFWGSIIIPIIIIIIICYLILGFMTFHLIVMLCIERPYAFKCNYDVFLW
jgi:hypothetical protein